ncbi:hypothetical protein AX16_009423 [Volvariella volvacea WC 439]|nr:hypothetical protein AX16_009423 [Volvariella volvacea WC 439]
MVFRIMRVLVPKDQSVILFRSTHNGNVIADPAAILSGQLILAFPGTGYIRMIDRGHIGHERHALLLSNAVRPWYYSGVGKAVCELHEDGRYTWRNEDGSNSIEGRVVEWM